MKYICQNLRIIISKIVKRRLTVFLYPLFVIIPKIFNIVKFTIVFKIIYYNIMLFIECINNKFLNFVFLSLKIWLNYKKMLSIIY